MCYHRQKRIRSSCFIDAAKDVLLAQVWVQLPRLRKLVGIED
jgi:hypothetical protein